MKNVKSGPFIILALVLAACSSPGAPASPLPGIASASASSETSIRATASPTAVRADTSRATTDTEGTDNYSSATIGTLRYVPAGTFQRDAIATNTSTVSAFRISQFEITRAQYVAIMGPGSDPSDIRYSSGTDDPVQRVNWYQAIAFCNKLSLAEGLEPAYRVSGVDFATLTVADIPITPSATWDAVEVDWSASGYRLPTEAEWVWAAIGATAGTSADAKAFSGSDGGNAVGDFAWTYENSQIRNTSQPVGTRLANELGLFDMSGNVWEWTWDWYGTVPAGAVTDYRGAGMTWLRSAHGGSWFNDATFAAPAFRHHSSPESQNHHIGFRVVRP